MFIQYTTTSKENELNKTLTNETRLESATFRDSEIDVIHPYFIIKTDELSGNYIYIEELNRYYFIDSMTKIDSVHTLIQCRCDVLMSFKTEIENSTGLLVKSTTTNPYFAQSTIESRTIKRRFEFPESDAFNSNGEYILITIKSV